MRMKTKNILPGSFYIFLFFCSNHAVPNLDRNHLQVGHGGSGGSMSRDQYHRIIIPKNIKNKSGWAPPKAPPNIPQRCCSCKACRCLSSSATWASVWAVPDDDHMQMEIFDPKKRVKEMVRGLAMVLVRLKKENNYIQLYNYTRKESENNWLVEVGLNKLGIDMNWLRSIWSNRPREQRGVTRPQNHVAHSFRLGIS